MSSLKTFITFDEDKIDRKALDLEALRDHIPHDALVKAVRAYHRANKEKIDRKEQPLRGVVFYEAHDTNLRQGGR